MASGNEKYDSSTLNLRDLETGNDTAFTCDSDERLQPIGFIDSDLVYGVAKVSDIDNRRQGKRSIPDVQSTDRKFCGRDIKDL